MGMKLTVAHDKEDGSQEPETEIAIKKVLQDKRFKVSWWIWI